MVSLGDSVPWGQGLSEDEKYDVLVRKALSATHPDSTCIRTAHSGAIIGEHPVDGPIADGEVPVARPTIIEQCDNFNDSPETVQLVLVNGGINDVDIQTILNPLVSKFVLSGKIQAFCYHSMYRLLQKVSAKFNRPDCRILVTGYYPILSDQSHFSFILDFLNIHGIAPPSFIQDNIIIDAVIDHCQQFFQESTENIKRAIAMAGDSRIVFAESGFTNANAVFAPESFLFGLRNDGTLSPEDPVALPRHDSCDVAFTAVQILEREQCYRASAGHPNQAGAEQYKRQILRTLATLGVM
jgi:hypothetical protein